MDFFAGLLSIASNTSSFDQTLDVRNGFLNRVELHFLKPSVKQLILDEQIPGEGPFHLDQFNPQKINEYFAIKEQLIFETLTCDYKLETKKQIHQIHPNYQVEDLTEKATTRHETQLQELIKSCHHLFETQKVLFMQGSSTQVFTPPLIVPFQPNLEDFVKVKPGLDVAAARKKEAAHRLQTLRNARELIKTGKGFAEASLNAEFISFNDSYTQMRFSKFMKDLGKPLLTHRFDSLKEFQGYKQQFINLQASRQKASEQALKAEEAAGHKKQNRKQKQKAAAKRRAQEESNQAAAAQAPVKIPAVAAPVAIPAAAPQISPEQQEKIARGIALNRFNQGYERHERVVRWELDPSLPQSVAFVCAFTDSLFNAIKDVFTTIKKYLKMPVEEVKVMIENHNIPMHTIVADPDCLDKYGTEGLYDSAHNGEQPYYLFHATKIKNVLQDDGSYKKVEEEGTISAAWGEDNVIYHTEWKKTKKKLNLNDLRQQIEAPEKTGIASGAVDRKEDEDEAHFDFSSNYHIDIDKQDKLILSIGHGTEQVQYVVRPLK